MSDRVTTLKLIVVVAALGALVAAGCGKAARARSQAPAGSQTASGGQPEMPPPFTLEAVRSGVAPANPYSAEQIERGRHLVMTGSCNDCHTPWIYDEEIGMPVPDTTRLLSGHPKDAPDPAGTLAPGDQAIIGPTFTSFRLPFGVVYTANLTPDIDTGTGSWTEKMFIDIFRTSRHLGGNGRPVLPPMPALWVSYNSDEDLVAIFAYLRSIPPVSNLVPSPAVPEEAIWQIRDLQDRMDAKVRAALPPTDGGDRLASAGRSAGQKRAVAPAGTTAGGGKAARAAQAGAGHERVKGKARAKKARAASRP